MIWHRLGDAAVNSRHPYYAAPLIEFQAGKRIHFKRYRLGIYFRKCLEAILVELEKILEANNS